MIRTRIAPSPTGNLHIGTARTALFNYLYAKNQGGKYIVRIEDTDKARSTQESEQNILEGLSWLGLSADEGVSLEGEVGMYGPYRQSQRVEVYQQYLQQLLDRGDAYWCLATSEELDVLKAKAESENQPFIFRPEYRDSQPEYQKGSVIRFRVKDQIITFDDKVKGLIKFDTSLLGDFVIAKSLEEPLYNFVVTIDDELMKISHIIRGEDHISNTPKQILINQALGFSKKSYAHLPLILAPDRSKMSKRYGAVSIVEYQKQGYLPEALINFLALLGWNDGTDREYYTLKELIDKFSLKRVQKSGAVFNIDKLNSINARYIKQLDLVKQYEVGREFLLQKAYDLKIFSDAQLRTLISIECQRISYFGEIGKGIEYLWKLEPYNSDILAWKDMSNEEVKNSLEWIQEVVYTIDDLSNVSIIENQIKTHIIESQKKSGVILWPLRVALSGQKNSISPFEILYLLGKEECIRRIQYALSQI